MNSDFKQLKDFLQSKVKLTADEIELFINAVEIKKLKKKELFIEQGSRALFKGFLNKGCCRIFFTDDNAKDNIIYFSFEGSWLGDIESYHLNKPSRISIQALEDCEFLVITKNSFQELEKQIPNINRWYDYTAVKMYSSLFDKLIENKIRGLEDKYNYLLKEYPFIFQRVPLQNIAEYLEIEPQSLSRLRKRLLNE